MPDDLIVEKRGHISVFTLNRPDKLNAMTMSMREGLTNGMADFNADPDQYVAIVTGAGDRAFCPGADLTELAARAKGGGEIGASTVDMYGVGSSPKPTIAAINGLAVAGGLELSLTATSGSLPTAHGSAYLRSSAGSWLGSRPTSSRATSRSVTLCIC